MTTAREETVVVSGIATFPNELGMVPNGSLAAGQNVVVRRPGVIETQVTPTVLGTLADADTFVQRAFSNRSLDPETGALLKVFGSDASVPATVARWVALDYSDIGGVVGPNVQLGANTRATSFPVGETQMTESRNRFILTEDHAPIVFDGPIPTTAGRPAGLPAPAAMSIALQIGDEQIIAAGNYVLYSALFFRQFSDGYEYRGAPTTAYSFFASSAGTAKFVVYWSKGNTPVRAGDKVEIYRSSQDSTLDAIPVEFALSTTYVLTSTDITNGFTPIIVDRVWDAGLGAALYTNSGVDGADMANYMPPPSRDAITYRGATLYASKQAWTTTELQVLSSFGLLTSPAQKANGIGYRQFSGTQTAGSPVFTVGSAPEVVGLKAGQILTGSTSTSYPPGTKILSVVGLVVTMTANCTGATGANVLEFSDVIVVNGKTIRMKTPDIAVVDMATTDSGVVMLPNQTLDPTAAYYDGFAFELVNQVSGEPNFTLSGTNPQNYFPNLNTAPISASPQDNVVYYSRILQPESVPLVSFFSVGTGKVLRMAQTNSAAYAFCTDGLFRITGDGVTFRIDPVDQSTILVHPDMLDTMEGAIYAWVLAGMSAISDTGIDVVSLPIQDEVREQWSSLVSASGLLLSGSTVECDQFRREVWWNVVNGTGGFPGDDPIEYKTWVYNLDTKAWTSIHANEGGIGANFTTISYSPSYRAVLGWTYGQLWGFLPDDILAELSGTRSYLPAGVLFNPFHLELGDLQQWLSIQVQWAGLYTGDRPLVNAIVTPVYVRDNPANTEFGGLTQTLSTRDQRSTIFSIPRNAGNSNLLQFGLSTASDVEGGITGYVAISGLSYRYRVASQTLKRQ